MTAAQDAAITDGTRSQRTRSWERYLVFLDAIEHSHDPYLDSLDRWERIDLLSCFAAAIREGFPNANDAGCAVETCTGWQASTVRATLDGVAQTFRVNKLGTSPMHDSRGRFGPILAAQLRGYSNDDPGTAQQQAVPAAVVSIASSMQGTNLGEATGQLIVTAFFFAMRSCEYSTVQGNHIISPIYC